MEASEAEYAQPQSQDMLAKVLREHWKSSSGEGMVIEVFQGSMRSGGLTDKTVVVCSSHEQAVALRSKPGGEKFAYVVADAQDNLPIKNEAATVADPHRATYIQERNYSTPGERLGQFVQELRALATKGQTERPRYPIADHHEEMLVKMQDVLADRARLLREEDKLVFSVAARRPETPAEEGYYAEHDREGQICVSQQELSDLLAKAGLEAEATYGGMAPKSQLVATESAAKSLIMSILGPRMERWFDEKLIASVHRVLDKVGSKKAKPEKEEEMKVSGVGKIIEEGGFPDRFIVVAKRRATG